ncbi:MAG: TonB C-terminal domain-containing protein [Acidobacteria bacterium]|nr:TonB C-terminal domain-containing protein [Acidobacteriota bacterium]
MNNSEPEAPLSGVTEVIVARARRPEPFDGMLVWSIAAHACVLGFLLFGPMDWGVAADQIPTTVMTISLGGAPGPRETGQTQMGGRTVEAPPPEAVERAMPPPPPREVEHVLPVETPPQRPRATPPPREEPQEGVTRTETSTRGQGFGLSTGGAGGSGVQLDVADFCCPEYIEQMVTLIQRNWQANQGVRGATLMRFVITRSGTIENVVVERPSGLLALDLAAQRALLTTRLAELPVQFPNPTLTVHLTFEYQR